MSPALDDRHVDNDGTNGANSRSSAVLLRLGAAQGAAESRVLAGEPDRSGTPPLVRIASGPHRPADAHVAVRHRGSWFWIDGSDAASKRTFLIAQILLSLTDTSNTSASPLVTLPAG